MNLGDIGTIVFAIVSVAIGFIATYFKTHAKLSEKVTSFISEAEKTYTDVKTGGQKMQFVIGKLYDLIPAAVRPFLPQSLIETLVQGIFDKVDDYAQQQLDKSTAKIEESTPTTAVTTTEA